MLASAAIEEKQQLSQYLFYVIIPGTQLFICEKNNAQNQTNIKCDDIIVSVHPYKNDFFIIVDRVGTIYHVNIESEIPTIKTNVTKTDCARKGYDDSFVLNVKHSPTSPYLIFNFRTQPRKTEKLHIYDVNNRQVQKIYYDNTEFLLIRDIFLISPCYIAILWRNTHTHFDYLGIYFIDRIGDVTPLHKVINNVFGFEISPCANYGATFHNDSSCMLWDIRNGKWKPLFKNSFMTIGKPKFTTDGRFQYSHTINVHGGKCEEAVEVDLGSCTGSDLARLFSVPSFIYKNPANRPAKALQSEHLWDTLLADWFNKLLLKIFVAPLPLLPIPLFGMITSYLPILIFDIFAAFPELAYKKLISQFEKLSEKNEKQQMEAIIEFALLHISGKPIPRCIELVTESYGVSGKKELPKFLLTLFSEVEKIIENNPKPNAAPVLFPPASAASESKRGPAPAAVLAADESKPALPLELVILDPAAVAPTRRLA